MLVLLFLVIGVFSQYDDVECFSYMKEIQVSYTGGTLTDTDLLLELDTSTPFGLVPARFDVEDGRCLDMRFRVGDTWLDYWVENSCPSDNTRVWVTVPSIAEDFVVEWFYYCIDPINAAYGSEDLWSGYWVIPSVEADCGAGEAFMENRFLKASLTDITGPVAGEMENHRHTLDYLWTLGATTTDGCSLAGGDQWTSTGGHYHHLNSTTLGPSSLPRHLEMVMCQNRYLDVEVGRVLPYSGAVPAGSSHVTALEGIYPYGALAYNPTEAGSADHTHDIAPGLTVAGDMAGSHLCSTLATSVVISPLIHEHALTYASTVTPADNEMASGSMPFAEVTDAAAFVLDGNSYMFVTEMPSYGYVRDTSYDGRYIMGGADDTIRTIYSGPFHGIPGGFQIGTDTSFRNVDPGGDSSALDDHDHADSGAIMLPHDEVDPEYDRFEVIVVQRIPNPSLDGVVVGTEVLIRDPPSRPTGVVLPPWAIYTIAGGSAGALVAVVVAFVLVVVFCFCCRRKGWVGKVVNGDVPMSQQPKKEKHHSSSSSSSD